MASQTPCQMRCLKVFLSPSKLNSQGAELISFRAPCPHCAHHSAAHKRGSNATHGQQSKARSSLASVPYLSPHPSRTFPSLFYQTSKSQNSNCPPIPNILPFYSLV